MPPALTAPARRRYGLVAIVLHWTIAAAILVQLMLALRMQGAHSPQTYAVFQLHKSVGITILALSLLRLGWRLANPPPPLPDVMAGWEKALARASHAGFYLVMIAMPLTGWLMVSTSPLRLPTLLYGRLPWPDLPGFAHLAQASREPWRMAGQIGHQSLALLFVVLFALHVAGALKHQLFDGDPVLGRMAPGARPGRLLEPRLIAIGLGALAALLLGVTLNPPPAPAPTSPAPPAPFMPPPEPAAAPATADSTPPVGWVVKPGSILGFTTAWGGQPIAGRFDRWRADIRFAPRALAASRVVITVDLGSISTGDRQRDAVLPGPDWFDMAAHPQAVFTAEHFQPVGPGRYLARGRLDLRGVSRPVELGFQLAIEGREARATGQTVLDRRAFGIGRGEWAATDQIPAGVVVRFDLRARRAG